MDQQDQVARYRYYEKSAGRERVFKPVAGKFLARLRDRLEEPFSLPDLGQHRVVAGRNESGGVVILQVIEREPMPEAAPGLRAASLVDGAVEAFLSVFEDENGHEVFFLPDEIAVQFRADVAPSRIREVLQEAGVTPARDYGDPHLAAVRTRPEELFDAVDRLARCDEVEIAGLVSWALDSRDDNH